MQTCLCHGREHCARLAYEQDVLAALRMEDADGARELVLADVLGEQQGAARGSGRLAQGGADRWPISSQPHHTLSAPPSILKLNAR